MTKKTEAITRFNRFDAQGRCRMADGLFLWRLLTCRTRLVALSFFSLFFLFSIPLKAQEISNMQMLNKTLQGEIGAKTGQGFALVYKSDSKSEYEMWFPLSEKVQFIGGYSAAQDMEFGDKVLVTYDETQDGKNRYLRSINLIKKKERTAAKAESNSETESEAEEEEAEQN